MAALFRRRRRLPSTKDVDRLFTEFEETVGSGDQDAKDEVMEKLLDSLKSVICGNEECEPSEDQTKAMAALVYERGMLLALLRELPEAKVENKKRYAYIFNNLINHEVDGRYLTVQHILDGGALAILDLLTEGYDQSSQMALVCGQMIRACAVHEDLCKYFLESPSFDRYMDHIISTNFSTSSDSWNTMVKVLTSHDHITDAYLDDNYERFFVPFVRLLNPDEYYVACRQALNLLAQLLARKTSFRTRFLGDVRHLQRMLALLNNSSVPVKVAAFHVFKVFLAVREKDRRVLKLLLKNKAQLLTYFANFQTSNDDESLKTDRELLVNLIQQLEPPEDDEELVAIAAENAAAATTAATTTTSSSSDRRHSQSPPATKNEGKDKDKDKDKDRKRKRRRRRRLPGEDVSPSRASKRTSGDATADAPDVSSAAAAASGGADTDDEDWFSSD